MPTLPVHPRLHPILPSSSLTARVWKNLHWRVRAGASPEYFLTAGMILFRRRRECCEASDDVYDRIGKVQSSVLFVKRPLSRPNGTTLYRKSDAL